MSWQDFELLIGEHFRRGGYSVRETAGGADRGVDLILNKDGATYFAQCKQWKAYKVGVKIVRELLGVMFSRGSTGGFVVTRENSPKMRSGLRKRIKFSYFESKQRHWELK